MHETKIEAKIHEEIKPLEETCKKMAEEFAACIDNTDASAIPVAAQITDMIKDLAEAKEKIVKACYYKYILSAMEKSEEEDKEEEKFYLRMMKEENKDEFNRMREEYGEDEGERRFYDNYRYANGRFAPKGRGTYRPRSSGRRRRGYEEAMIPMEYQAGMDMYPPEYWRDMDRTTGGRMYYSGGTSGGNSGSGSNGSDSGSSSGMSGGNSDGSSRSYAEGYNDGEENGYQRGYQEGERRGRRSGNGSQSRYDKARRGYEETKMSDDGTPESKKKAMESLDKYMKELADDMTELVSGMDNSEKTMLKSKMQGLMQRIQ